MDTPEVTDAPPAASSAAPLDPSTALAEASPAAYDQWRKTGELPRPEATEPLSPPADSTPAAPVEQAPDATAAPSAEKKDTGKPRTDARAEENRVPVLLADRAKERERAEKAEARAAQLERELSALRHPAIPDAKPAVSSPAPADDPEPDPENVEKYPDGLYDRKFLKDQAAWEARSVVRAERTAALEAAKQQREEARVREQSRSWTERVNAAKAKYPDFEAKAFGPSPIEAGSPIDVWIMESPQGADLLYHLHSNPDEVRRIAALPAVHQVRELVKLETQLEPAPAKTITDAPAVPRTLGDRTAGAADPVARALANKDPGAYIDAMNKQELAARRV